MIKTAVLSDCGKYRYSLTRNWGGVNLCHFIMLNPSTADALDDDPTIRRCIKFAKGFGFDGLIVTNLFAFRATNPQDLYAADDPVGPRNDETIKATAKLYREAICAWGNHGGYLLRDAVVLDLLDHVYCTPYALNLTKMRKPGHPLYLKSNSERIAL